MNDEANPVTYPSGIPKPLDEAQVLALMELAFPEVPPAEIRDHLTISTPPTVAFEDLDFQFRNRKKQTKPEGYMLLAINAVLAVLPAFWVRRIKAEHDSRH